MKIYALVAKKTTVGSMMRCGNDGNLSRELVSSFQTFCFSTKKSTILLCLSHARSSFTFIFTVGPIIWPRHLSSTQEMTTKEPIISENSQNCAMAEPMPGCKLFVGNITERVQKHQLRSDFEKFGRVNEVFIGQGFGFITFDRPG